MLKQIEDAKAEANRALDAAEKACYQYAILCELGEERRKAFEVYENVRLGRRVR